MYRKGKSSWLKHADFVILDILCLQLAFIISYWIRHGVDVPYRDSLYGNMALVLVFIQIVVSFFFESFSGILRRGDMVEAKTTARHTTLVALLAITYLFLSQQGGSYSRMTLVLMWFFYVIFAYFGRLLLKRFLNTRKFTEGEERSLLIVTSSAAADNVISTIRGNNYGTFHLAGVVLMDCDKTGQALQGIPVVAGADSMISYIHKNWVDEVLFAMPKEILIPEQLIKDCSSMGVVIHMRLATMKSLGRNQTVEELAGYTVLSSSIRIVTPRQMFIKRSMDILGGLTGCLITAILYLFIAPVMKVKSPGPVFFSQTRVGKNGKPFKIYKFRSMYMDAEERKKELMEKNNIKDGLMFKMDDDPRIIKGIGHFIRKTSIDEFPQFWNVLKGDMSLVGTRPPTVDEWEKYELHHRKRLAIKPGLTGMWQVSGRSEITDFEEVVELDTAYIADWSLKMDVKILMKTVMVVVLGSGAK